jgi:hypothetical protein
MYHIFFINSSVNWLLGWFHNLVVVNSAAILTWLCTCLYCVLNCIPPGTFSSQSFNVIFVRKTYLSFLCVKFCSSLRWPARIARHTGSFAMLVIPPNPTVGYLSPLHWQYCVPIVPWEHYAMSLFHIFMLSSSSLCVKCPWFAWENFCLHLKVQFTYEPFLGISTW